MEGETYFLDQHGGKNERMFGPISSPKYIVKKLDPDST